MEAIKKLFNPLKTQALNDLARLVNANSFSGSKENLATAGDLIMEIAAGNGLKLAKYPTGDKAAFHLTCDTDDPDFIGVIGHFDTVHPPESPFRTFSDRGETLTGPGVQDMKSGIIAAIYGLRVAREALGVSALPVKIVFNCDEETGSIDSRPLIESLMKGARAAFIFEGKKFPDNALVTSRKGIMMGEMVVKGKNAHAGEAPHEGASAVVEAAHKIVALDGLTDLDEGVVVTTGKVKGGKVPNQIADLCTSSIDIRFRTREHETMLRGAVEHIMAETHVPGCTTDYVLETARPPFVKDPGCEALKQQYVDAAAEFGIPVPETDAGGGSDGNLTAAMGIPTIDGLGPSGDFPHTDKEYIHKASFFSAVEVFALLLSRIQKS